MSDDITNTLKWWIQHANELEKERDKWRNVAKELYEADALGVEKAFENYRKALNEQ